MARTIPNGLVPDECKGCSHWDEAGQRARVRTVLVSMVDKIEEKLEGGDFKPTVVDFLRALEADQQIDDTNVGLRTIIARWEDPSATRSE